MDQLVLAAKLESLRRCIQQSCLCGGRVWLEELPVKQATNTIAAKISAAMTGEIAEPQNIGFGASVDKTQIGELITNLQSLLKSA